MGPVFHTWGLERFINMVFNRGRLVPSHLCTDYCIFGLSTSGLTRSDCIYFFFSIFLILQIVVPMRVIDYWNWKSVVVVSIMSIRECSLVTTKNGDCGYNSWCSCTLSLVWRGVAIYENNKILLPSEIKDESPCQSQLLNRWLLDNIL